MPSSRPTLWINFSFPAQVLILLISTNSYAKAINPVLKSTVNSLILTFPVNPAALNYTASFRRSDSIFYEDIYEEPPYNESSLSITFLGALSGYNYSVQLYENTTTKEDSIFESVIATVPVPPINVRVTGRGSSFLFLEWDSGIQRPYSSHSISFKNENSTSARIVQGTADLFFNLTGLDSGFEYEIKIQAVSFYPGGATKGDFSEAISNYTLPAKPINLTANAVNTTHITLTWKEEPGSYQDTFQIQYFTQDGNSTVSCDDSPCLFSPEPPAGQNVTAIIFALAHGLLSEGAQIKCSTEPGMVDNLRALRGVRSLDISWSPPFGSIVSSYRVSITNIMDNLTKTDEIPASENEMLSTYLAEQLQGGVAYRVSVEAKTNFATGKPTIDVFYTGPEAVLNLRAEAINTTAILISWKNPVRSEFENIGIDVRKTDNDTLNLKEDSSSESRLVTGLVPGELYFISVTVLTKTPLLKSEALNTTVNTKPVMPMLLTSLSKERELTVGVDRSEDDGVYDGFNLLLKNEANQIIQNITTESVATFSELDPGTAYTLEVYTESGMEKSEPFFINLYTRPRPPRDLIVEVFNGSIIHAEWKLPDEGGYDNFTITIEEAEEGSPPQERITEDTQVDFYTATAGTMYNVTVVTIKGDQRSDEISEQNTTAPLNVNDIRVWVRGVTSVSLVWDPPIASSLDGYAINFPAANLTLLELPPNLTTYKFEDLDPDTEYFIEMLTLALRPDGVKLYSLPRQFNFSTYPESVAALHKVEATSSSITVNWTAPVDGDFNLFQMGLREDSINPRMIPFLVPRSQTNYTFEGLKPGQLYSVAIRTVLQLPQQRPRYGISVRLKAVTQPLPVLDLMVTSLNTSAVAVTWVTNQTSLQDSFLIRYGQPDSAFKMFSVDSLNSTYDYEINIDQLISGTEHIFEVVSIRAVATDSEESAPATETGFTVPMPVSNLTIVLEATTLKLSWEKPSEGGWDGYQIDYQPLLRSSSAAIQKMTAPSDSLGVQISDLFPGEKYAVNVSAAMNELLSEAVSSSKIIDPLQAQEVSEDRSKKTVTSVTIQWIYDAKTYYVEKWEVSHSNGNNLHTRNETATEKSMYIVETSDLKSGETYDFKVTSIVRTARSPVVDLSVTTKPVINTEFEEIGTTNSSLRFGYTVNVEDIFDSFIFSIINIEESIEKAKSDNNREVIFENLEAGTQYTVNAITTSNGEESSPFSWQFITDPNPVPVSISATAREITLKLGMQPVDIATHTISCSPAKPNTAQCPELTKTVEAAEATVKFSGLHPFTEYTFDVITKTKKVNNIVKEASMTHSTKTAEDAPSNVQQVRISDVQLHSVLVSWNTPAEPNGIVRNYIVFYSGKEPNFIDAPVDQNIVTVSATQTNKRLYNLKAGYQYLIKVFARTVSDGQPLENNVTLPTGNPAFKSSMTAESSKPTVDTQATGTQSKLTIEFMNPFSSERGFVSSYTVIVTKDPTADDTSPTLPSWSDAQKDSSIKVYQAFDRCNDFFSDNSQCGMGTNQNPSSRKKRAVNDKDSRVFTLGDQTQEDCSNVKFCNGALEEDTEYYVKLRGFTSSGSFSETVYSEPIKTAKGPTSNAGMIGGVIAAVVIVILIAVAVLLYMRKRQKPMRASKHTGSNSNWEQSSLNKLSRTVKLVDFADHLRKMSADSDFKYAEEYEDLKEVGRGQPTLASEFPPNRPKNRFTNILPYDHSRVKLLPTDDEEGSDYINANYMPGFSSKREYIATQGPLLATRDDFWRMLWEQCCRNVVMLTKCQEKGREKSDHYWPTDMEPKYYGDLQVLILAETPMPDWTVTELKVSLGDKSRNVRHFHYRSWPDFGVPKDPTSLIRFVRTVREKLISEGSPIITHCSAGVGRSGTFIILDHVLQLIREKDEVDIFSMVYKLRKERVLMVQTEQQYKFIHECLLCVLENREDDTTYANLGQINIGYEED